MASAQYDLISVLLRTAEEEIQRWKEHFEGVLNHAEPPNPPEVEPGQTPSHVLRSGILLKSLRMGRQREATIYHQRQSRVGVRCQRKSSWAFVTG